MDRDRAASGMGFREWLTSHDESEDCTIGVHGDGCMSDAYAAGARSAAAFVGICVRCDAAITREEATRSTAAEGRTAFWSDGTTAIEFSLVDHRPTEREKAHEALDAYLNAVVSCQLRNCDCVRLRIAVDNAIIVAVATWRPTEAAKGE